MKCNECGKEFATKGGLTLHVYRMHTPGGKGWGKKSKGRPWSVKRRAAQRRKSEMQPELDLRDNEMEKSGQSETFGYCPRCGYHLAPLYLVLKLKERMR